MRVSLIVVERGVEPTVGVPALTGLAPFTSRSRVERTGASTVRGLGVSTRSDVVLSGLTVVGMSARSTFPLPPIDLPPPGILNRFGVGP